MEMTTADAEVAAITAEIDAIEPHPHAHGHTAAGDCTYAGLEPAHFLSLAGLLAQPLQDALVAIEVSRQEGIRLSAQGVPDRICHFRRHARS
ncbi:hypothetical protein MOP88_06625 [Sphingomonas sp. WKB10]|nr:hypothetical protein [Sphingomonas sp. WKB10]